MIPDDSVPGVTPDLLTAIALSVHNVVGGMPVAVKARGEPGVIVTGGRPQDMVGGSEALDRIFNGEPVSRIRADCGDYAGIPMYASAIFDSDGKAVAAIGVIDTSGMLSLHEFAEISAALTRQSESAALSRQSDNAARPKE